MLQNLDLCSKRHYYFWNNLLVQTQQGNYHSKRLRKIKETWSLTYYQEEIPKGKGIIYATIYEKIKIWALYNLQKRTQEGLWEKHPIIQHELQYGWRYDATNNWRTMAEADKKMNILSSKGSSGWKAGPFTEEITIQITYYKYPCNSSLE